MTCESNSSSETDDGWVNPYRDRVRQFPGRIFCVEDDTNDGETARTVVNVQRARIVELGSGSGNHLIALAGQNPDANCFGFEIRYKRSVRTIQKADREGRANVYVFRADARRITEFFQASSVSALFVNFPDPWERKRDWKHRILSADLLANAQTLLTPDGFLSVKTDHKEYFATFLEIVRSDSNFEIVETSADLHRSEFAARNIETEFEGIFRTQRLPVAYAKLVSRARLATT